MKTKMITVGVLLVGLAISLVSYTNKNSFSTYSKENNITVSEGETLFKEKCSTCHISTKPKDMNELVAPPMMAVMMHVKNAIKGKDEAEKRENAIVFIVDYVQNPSEDKSLLEKRAIERFKVMPSQKENVTKEELEIIANYIYDNFPPKGMTHKKMMKGNKKASCGAGCGNNCSH
jgi:cytochrome c